MIEVVTGQPVTGLTLQLSVTTCPYSTVDADADNHPVRFDVQSMLPPP